MKPEFILLSIFSTGREGSNLGVVRSFLHARSQGCVLSCCSPQQFHLMESCPSVTEWRFLESCKIQPQRQSLLSCKFYRNIHFTRKKKSLWNYSNIRAFPRFSPLVFVVVKICFQMFISKIIYWHLNIDGFIFPQLPLMSPVQKKTYFVNKIKYIFRKMVSGVLLWKCCQHCFCFKAHLC